MCYKGNKKVVCHFRTGSPTVIMTFTGIFGNYLLFYTSMVWVGSRRRIFPDNQPSVVTEYAELHNYYFSYIFDGDKPVY